MGTRGRAVYVRDTSADYWRHRCVVLRIWCGLLETQVRVTEDTDGRFRDSGVGYGDTGVGYGGTDVGCGNTHSCGVTQALGHGKTLLASPGEVPLEVHQMAITLTMMAQDPSAQGADPTVALTHPCSG